jgi:protein TonB
VKPVTPVPDDKSAKSDKPVKSEKPAVKNDPAAVQPGSPAQASAKPAAAEKSAIAEKSAPAPAAQTAPVEETEAAPGSNKMIKLLLAAAASIALFVVLFVYPGFVRTSSKPSATSAVDSSPLQLRVERTAGELLLTWNRDSDAIRNATKAVLVISDGDQHENVEMDLAQLRNGSIVYSPTGADISFKMEVTGKNQKTVASESVRVLRTRPSPMDDQAQTPTPNAQAAGKGGNAAAPDAQAEKTAANAGGSGIDPVVEDVKPATPQTPVLKPFSTASLSQRLRPVTTADLPDAPTLAGTGAVPTAIPGVNLNAGVQAPSAPQAPAPPKPAAPAPPVQATPQAATLKPGGQIQQATLIYKKDPEYPKIAKQTGAKGQVKLLATIGKDGRVKAVKVLSGHPMLTSAAVEAVRQWVYKPTMLNGAPVENETEIQINFMGDK